MSSHRAPQGAMPAWRVALLDGWWQAASKLPLVWRVASWRCRSRRPARCFVPTPGVPGEDGVEGYYRWGLLAQYCVRWRGHRGRCVAPINADGWRVPGGAVFQPERDEPEEDVDATWDLRGSTLPGYGGVDEG